MNDILDSGPPRHPVSVERLVDQVCNRFEQAWRTGQSPRVEDFLAQADPVAREPLPRELVALEVFYRRRLGEVPTAAEYAARFPDLSAAVLAEIEQNEALASRAERGKKAGFASGIPRAPVS